MKQLVLVDLCESTSSERRNHRASTGLVETKERTSICMRIFAGVAAHGTRVSTSSMTTEQMKNETRRNNSISCIVKE